MSSAVEIALASDTDLDALVGLLCQQLAEHNAISSAMNLREAVAAVLENDRLGFILAARKGTTVVGCAYVSFVWSEQAPHAARRRIRSSSAIGMNCR